MSDWQQYLAQNSSFSLENGTGKTKLKNRALFIVNEQWKNKGEFYALDTRMGVLDEDTLLASAKIGNEFLKNIKNLVLAKFAWRSQKITSIRDHPAVFIMMLLLRWVFSYSLWPLSTDSINQQYFNLESFCAGLRKLSQLVHTFS